MGPARARIGGPANRRTGRRTPADNDGGPARSCRANPKHARKTLVGAIAPAWRSGSRVNRPPDIDLAVPGFSGPAKPEEIGR